MRTEFAEFDEALLESSKNRNWLVGGLLVSLAIHGALCGYFYRTNFLPARNLLEERVPTAMFKVKNVDTQPLDKAASVDQTNAAAKPDPDKTDVQLPDEKKSFDQMLEEMRASVAMPDDTSNVLPDNPKVEQTDVTSTLNQIEQ